MAEKLNGEQLGLACRDVDFLVTKLERYDLSAILFPKR
jgi:hypothetical protein